MFAGLLFLSGCPADEGDPPVELNLDQLDSTETPSRRSEVLAIPDPTTGKIVVFGGNDGPIVSQFPRAAMRKDTWLFEPGAGWSKVEGSGPSKRSRYGAALDPTGGRVLFFGGRMRPEDESGDYTLFNDLWSFDMNAKTWTRLDKGNGTAPTGRYYPSTLWDDAKQTLYMWGGATNAGWQVISPSDELWSWTESAGWQLESTTGNAPSTRVFFAYTHDTTRNSLVVFAGQVGDFQSNAYNDLYSLDLDTFKWTRLHGGNNAAPSTRMNSALIYDADADQYLMFGGHTDIGDGNDLWSFDPDTEEWSVIYQGDVFDNTTIGCDGNGSEVPADYVIQDPDAPERRHRGMFALMHGSLWLFGGMHSECSGHLDDTWRFDLSTEAWTELIEATSGESCERRGDDCVCLCI